MTFLLKMSNVHSFIQIVLGVLCCLQERKADGSALVDEEVNRVFRIFSVCKIFRVCRVIKKEDH